jgi:hypothetical protein
MLTIFAAAAAGGGGGVLQDIQLKDLTRTRATLNEAQHECARLRQQLTLAQQ